MGDAETLWNLPQSNLPMRHSVHNSSMNDTFQFQVPSGFILEMKASHRISVNCSSDYMDRSFTCHSSATFGHRFLTTLFVIVN